MAESPLDIHSRLLQEARRELEKARREVARWEKLVAAFEGDIAAEESYLVSESLQSVPTSAIMGQMDLGHNEDSRALKIAKTRSSGKKRDPAYQAILDAGLTPDEAAALCGTTRDVLKQAWRKGKQLRPARPEWIKTLEKHGVPRTVWRTKN